MTVELHPTERKRILAEIKNLQDQIDAFPVTFGQSRLQGLVDGAHAAGISLERARPIYLRFFIDLMQARIDELQERLTNPGATPASD